jgi:hypothetical protein
MDNIRSMLHKHIVLRVAELSYVEEEVHERHEQLSSDILYSLPSSPLQHPLFHPEGYRLCR